MSFKSILSKYTLGSSSVTKKRPRSEEAIGQISNKDSEKKVAIEQHPQSNDQFTYEGPPHFIIIGVQKGGTTAARHNLNKHPEIYVHEEIHFFDYHWPKTSKWYFNLFTKPEALKKKVLGEKTPELIYVDVCAQRIKEVCPNTKFMVFLRNPIDRAYSEWNMNIKDNIETLKFGECVTRNLNDLNEYRSNGTSHYHYVQKGFYMDQIERFQQVFPNPNQMLIIISEHIRHDPDTQFRRIYEFLGASHVQIDAEEEYVGKYKEPINPAVAEKLKAVYKPHNERLFKYLGYRIPEWE